MYEEISEGQILVGKYRVERVLGEGGMGVVVAARHLQLDERVALKFMRAEALVNSEAVARFAREARAAVKIKSEHVARVSDVGTLENGAPYLVMEYLDGSDLSAWLKQYGRLPIEQAAEFVLQAGEAIAEAHALGIVHRDLKPANLFVLRRPDGAWSVKVLDFGISKMTGVGASGPDFGMTKTNAVMGSPHYMSPEQMQSVKDVDARSDIWAIGVILYELLTGVTPFAADSFFELVLKITCTAPEPLRNHVPEASAGLERVISRCLDKDPGKRFANMGELAVALLEFAPQRSRLSVERISGVLKVAGMEGNALSLPLPTGGVSPVAVGTAASWGKTVSGSSAGKRALFAAGAVLAVAALGLAGYVWHTGIRLAATAEAPSSTSAVSAVVSVVSPPPPQPAQLAEATALQRVEPSVSAAASPSASEAAPPVVPAKRPRSTHATPVSPTPHATQIRPSGSDAPPAPVPQPKPAVKNTGTVFDDR